MPPVEARVVRQLLRGSEHLSLQRPPSKLGRRHLPLALGLAAIVQVASGLAPAAAEQAVHTPHPPIGPTDMAQCDALQKAWSDLFSWFSAQHGKCLASGSWDKNSGDKNSGTCAKRACQPYHDPYSQFPQQRTDVEKCRREVSEYSERNRQQEKLAKDALERMKAAQRADQAALDQARREIGAYQRQQADRQAAAQQILDQQYSSQYDLIEMQKAQLLREMQRTSAAEAPLGLTPEEFRQVCENGTRIVGDLFRQWHTTSVKMLEVSSLRYDLQGFRQELLTDFDSDFDTARLQVMARSIGHGLEAYLNSVTAAGKVGVGFVQSLAECPSKLFKTKYTREADLRKMEENARLIYGLAQMEKTPGELLEAYSKCVATSMFPKLSPLLPIFKALGEAYDFKTEMRKYADVVREEVARLDRMTGDVESQVQEMEGEMDSLQNTMTEIMGSCGPVLANPMH